MRHNQSPLDWSLPNPMLVMVLGGKDVVLRYGYFMATHVAMVYSRPRSWGSGSYQLIECLVVAILNELLVFVQCHSILVF